MGAAGYVTVYRRSDVEKLYVERHPDRVLTEDWWYLDTITAELDGERWVFDYGDDQGFHEGSWNAFWFKSEDGEPWDSNAAQGRVRAVLNDCARKRVEVWT